MSHYNNPQYIIRYIYVYIYFYYVINGHFLHCIYSGQILLAVESGIDVFDGTYPH